MVSKSKALLPSSFSSRLFPAVAKQNNSVRCVHTALQGMAQGVAPACCSQALGTFCPRLDTPTGSRRARCRGSTSTGATALSGRRERRQWRERSDRWSGRRVRSLPSSSLAGALRICPKPSRLQPTPLHRQRIFARRPRWWKEKKKTDP